MDVKNRYFIDLTGLGNIFWGFIFVGLDFRVNGFDLLPNFIGFIIIIVGLYKLTDISSRFKKAKLLAFLSLGLSFFSIVQVSLSLDSISTHVLIFNLALGLFTLIVNLYLYYYIISGIKDIALSCESDEFYSQGDSVFKRIFIVDVINYIFIFIFIFLGDSLFIILVALMLISVIIEITFLMYLRNVRKYLHGAEIK